MRDEGFRRAMNTVSPTPEQRERMRSALASRLPQEEPFRYQGRPERVKRFSWLPAVAALLAVAIGGGLALMKGTLPTSRKPDVSTVESVKNTRTASLETLLSSPEYLGRLAMEQKDPDQLNALIQQFGLTVEEEGADTDGWELANQLGIQKGSNAFLVSGGQYYSATGSSSYSGTTVMEGADWSYPVSYRVCYNASGAVVPALPVLDDLDAYDQWNYVSSDGAALVLALSPDDALVYGQTGGGFYVVYTEDNRVGDALSGERTMEKKDLEAFAETFRFPVTSAAQTLKGLEALYASPEFQARKQVHQKLLEQGEQADAKEIYQEAVDAYGLKWNSVLTVGLLGDYHRDTDPHPVTHIAESGGSDSYGSYCYVGTTTMDYSGSPWPYPIDYKFCVNPKGVFFAGLPVIGEPDSYTQWSYTNSDGMELTLGLSPEHAVIYCQASGGFYLVSVSVNQGEADRAMDAKALEAFAETFRFPQDAARITAGEKQFAAVLAQYKDVMEGGSGKWEKSTAAAIRVRGKKSFGYAFWDLDRDGSNELLMTGGTDLYAVYAGEGEQVHAILKDDGQTQYSICQDGTIFQWEDYALQVYRVEKGSLITLENVRVQSDPSSPWVRAGENGTTAISQEEYHQVRNSYRYKNESIPFTPLSSWQGYKEYVQNRLLGTVDPAYAAVIENYRKAVAQDLEPAQYSKFDISLGIAIAEDPMDTVGACLRDLDGDGEEELIITDGSTLYGVYTLENGTAKAILLSRERCRYYLCEDGYLYSEGSGGAAVTYYEFIRLEEKRMFTAESLMTDYSADPEEPWFRLSTGTDDTVTPITEEEFNRALSAHGEIRKDLPFTPLSQS